MPPLEADALQQAPKPNPRNNATMFQIFQNVQYNVVQHKKYVKEMTKLFKKMDQDAFRESFSNALHYLFTFGDTSANVDRVVQFVATFCTSLDDEEEFLLFIFEIIFDCQCVSGQSVRYRASQLLAAVLAALGEDASLDDDLCDKLLASQMQRLQDTRGAVRCRAALALQRLQNPADNDDEVTRAYRFHMSCDPSSSVRRAIVMSIAKSIRNVPFMEERLCDVDEAVRRAAFLYISAINVTQLKVKQRIHALKVGLNERSPRVRRVVEEILIPGWLSSFKGDIIQLLKAIRLDNRQGARDSQYVAGKLLESLFKRLPLSELLEWLPTDKNLRLIPAEKLNKETVWYWRHLAEYLQKLDDDETLETVLPDLVVLVGYIRAIVEAPCPSETEDPVGFSTRQYVLSELARLLRVYDAGDPVGRSMLQKLITDVLTGDFGPLNTEVIRGFVCALEAVLPEVSPRVEVVAGLVSELRGAEPEAEAEAEAPRVVVDSTDTKLQRARLRVSLNVAMEAQEEAVRTQNYSLAAECKNKVDDIQKRIDELNVPQLPTIPEVPVKKRDKQSSVEVLNKCLVILNSALDSPQITTITPMLQMIFNDLEVEIFQNPNLLPNSLETVALYGMLDKEFAKEHKAFFFAHIIDTENEPLVSVVIKCIIDQLSVHGVKVFDPEEPSQQDLSQSVDGKSRRNKMMDSNASETSDFSESTIDLTPSHSTVIELLLKLMDGTCPSYRQIVVEGLCRLMMLGHLVSPGILSRLILLWFNPATDEEDMLRQIIGVFFQTFPLTVDGAQEQIQKATLPTLRALANAPSNSPISEIHHEAVIRFIVSLTRVNHETVDSQGQLAVLLCSALARRGAGGAGGAGAEAALASRALALLAPPRDAATAAALAASLRDLCRKLTDKQSCRNLTRYLGALEVSERMSLNKESTVPLAESSIATVDFTATSGRATTSLPQPIARSTHVMIDETVEEEVEIDESSPTDVQAARASEIKSKEDTSSGDKATEAANDVPPKSPEFDEDRQPTDGGNISACRTTGSDSEGSSSDVSPVKRAKVVKKGKKKLSMPRSRSEKGPKRTRKDTAGQSDEAESPEGSDKTGVKRSRSQRSLVDVDTALSLKEAAKASMPPYLEGDLSNVTVRRSTRGLQSSSSTDSNGSAKSNSKGRGKSRADGDGRTQAKKTNKQTRSSTEGVLTRRSSAAAARASDGFASENSDDETVLHTIVYDQDIQQSLLNDSSELDMSVDTSKRNVTIPETPESSSDSEPEPQPAKAKAKSKRAARK